MMVVMVVMAVMASLEVALFFTIQALLVVVPLVLVGQVELVEMVGPLALLQVRMVTLEMPAWWVVLVLLVQAAPPFTTVGLSVVAQVPMLLS
ncbi:hypothetical protein ACOCLD_01515 [Pseudomonas sp. MAC6]|uniref:hypothetical protein n=1 Tax=Pseudomonas sp. MAC6 TaxID=3401633 RepID=UPI003BF51896